MDATESEKDSKRKKLEKVKTEGLDEKNLKFHN